VVNAMRRAGLLLACAGVTLVIASASASASGSVASPTIAARELVVAMEERLALAVPVAAAKRVSGAAVDDPVRESQAADAFVTLVGPDGVPESEARSFIQAQFEASKGVQRALLQQWAARPDTVPPGEPPNLVTQVRPAIDTATAKLAESYLQAREVAAADPAAWRSAIARQMRSPGGEWRWQRDSVRTALRPTLVLGRG
jgi:chorismate mutase